MEEHNGNVYNLQAQPKQIAVTITRDVQTDKHSDCVIEEGGRDISVDKDIV